MYALTNMYVFLFLYVYVCVYVTPGAGRPAGSPHYTAAGCPPKRPGRNLETCSAALAPATGSQDHLRRQENKVRDTY